MKPLSYYKKLKAKGWEREELEWYLSDPGYLMMETEKIMSNENIKFNEMLVQFINISEKEFYLINHCKTPRELEVCTRENKIFNMND